MSEMITLDFDLHVGVLGDTSPADRLDFVSMCFRRAIEANPSYTSVGNPEVTFIRVREGFLTGRVKFEVERSEVRAVQAEVG